MDSKQRLIEVLSLPSFSGKESRVSDYITKFCHEHGIDTYMDTHGNVYATKGEADFYPCVVSHIDTVHRITEIVVKENDYGDLYAETPDGVPTGIGGDDKAGVFVCLEMLLHAEVLKAAFFVAEEVGCLGSYLSDPKFFENVGYAIQFDAPFNNWISYHSDGERLFEIYSSFFLTIEEIFKTDMPGYDRTKCLGYHPYTDVSALKRLYDFSCINYSVGYYNMHSRTEYVVIDETFACLEMAKKMVAALGNQKYQLPPKGIVTEGIKERVARRLVQFKLPETDHK